MFRKPIALTALALAAACAQAAGTVQVGFAEPEKFTDFRDRNTTVEQNVKTLEKVIVETATPHVADGQTLKIDVLDVDLAGEPKPGARAFDVRVLRGGADWPRMKLHWSLEGAGTAPRGGDAMLQDLAYLQRMRPPAPYTSMAYERRMLEEWLRREFGKGAGG